MPTGFQPSLPGRKPITIPQHRPVPLHLFWCLHGPELSRDKWEVLPSPLPSPEGYTVLTCTLFIWEHGSCLCPSCYIVWEDERGGAGARAGPQLSTALAQLRDLEHGRLLRRLQRFKPGSWSCLQPALRCPKRRAWLGGAGASAALSARQVGWLAPTAVPVLGLQIRVTRQGAPLLLSVLLIPQHVPGIVVSPSGGPRPSL